MHDPLPDSGIVRKLWLGQADAYRDHLLRLDPDSRHRRFSGAVAAEVIARLEPEVMGEIRSCSGAWCRVRVSSVSGWLERKDLWGVYKSEPIN